MGINQPDRAEFAVSAVSKVFLHGGVAETVQNLPACGEAQVAQPSLINSPLASFGLEPLCSEDTLTCICPIPGDGVLVVPFVPSASFHRVLTSF
jgi:hypothetical protein